MAMKKFAVEIPCYEHEGDFDFPMSILTKNGWYASSLKCIGKPSEDVGYIIGEVEDSDEKKNALRELLAEEGFELYFLK